MLPLGGCNCTPGELSQQLPSADRDRTSGAPAPDPAWGSASVFLPGTEWSAGGRVLTLDKDLYVDGQRLGPAPPAVGGDTAAGRLIGVGPCSGVLFDAAKAAWIPMVRQKPVCTEAEAEHEPSSWTVWALPGGDQYMELPDGRTWRFGEDRSFKYPVGERVGSPGAASWDLVFGPSTFRVVPLDACSRVFHLEEPRKVSRATRNFPGCPPRHAVWGGPVWTRWKTNFGSWLDIDGPNRGEDGPGGIWSLDQPGLPQPQTGRWVPTPDGVELAGRGTLQIRGCAATLSWDGEVTEVERTFPDCAHAAK